ncbi:MAG TPA: sulfurtransferase TusA family protein [Candidatus Aphodousia faecipullorum]|nr:sulfurtransferase TusA family protein [Candidatus Aphodousia faecipullorum]
MQFDRQIDTRGTKCPMPVLKTKRALATMQQGEVLCVLATDPASMGDLVQFAKQTGHQILTQEEKDGVYIHYLKHK